MVQSPVPDTSSVPASAEKLDNFVADLLRRYEVPAGRYLWPREQSRWQELVFCVLASFGEPNVPAETARTTTEILDELALLGVEDLAGVLPESQRVLMHAILVRQGYEPGQSEGALEALHEVAASLVRHHQGKVQRYLREYGERMLAELADNFSFHKLGRAQARAIFAHWLQNVLNMPVTLDTAAVRACCERLGAEPKDLVAAADRYDLNLAVLDDLVMEYMRDEEALTWPAAPGST